MSDRTRGTSRKEVAAHAGVSPSTVSLVLNGRGDEVGVAKQTQQRIFAAARELRYVPNSAARAMVGRRHLTIGIVAMHPPLTLHVPFFAEFAVASIAEAASHEHTVKFLPPVAEADSYDVVAMLRDAQVDGILVHNLAWLAASLADWRVPVVYVGPPEDADELPVPQIGAVTVDECGGLRVAARHLIGHGHIGAVLVAGPAPIGQPVRRLEAFVEEFATGTGREDAVHQVQAGDWSAESGYAAMLRVLDEGGDVTAVHLGNDWMAAGALRALREAGRRVPDDIEVVGFGDFPVSGYLDPPLTTVRWPLRELGVQATQQLLARLGAERSEFHRTDLPAELVVRASTAGDSTVSNVDSP